MATPMARSEPDRMCWMIEGMLSKDDLHLAAEHVGDRRARRRDRARAAIPRPVSAMNISPERRAEVPLPEEASDQPDWPSRIR